MSPQIPLEAAKMKHRVTSPFLCLEWVSREANNTFPFTLDWSQSVKDGHAEDKPHFCCNHTHRVHFECL